MMKKRLCRTGGWMPIAIGIGAAMGSATGDMGLWLSLGAGIGLALETARRRGWR